MPVTAKLSKAFYEKFGEEATNELVNWLNAIDASYQTNLRELNELNFARFDAKLEQRVAQLDAKLEQRLAQLDAKLERRVAELRAEMNVRFAQADAALHRQLGELRSGLIKWMFGFWAGAAFVVIGTGVGVVGLLLRR